jgi:iron complex outermembrane recepter protein
LRTIRNSDTVRRRARWELQSIPSWTRFDAGVRYGFERKHGKPIEVRFNVENLFDLNYWTSASVNNGLAMGTPRTFLLSVGTRF